MPVTVPTSCYRWQNKYIDMHYIQWYSVIPAKSLHNCNIVSVHFNQFLCMEVCNTPRRDVCMYKTDRLLIIGLTVYRECFHHRWFIQSWCKYKPLSTRRKGNIKEKTAFIFIVHLITVCLYFLIILKEPSKEWDRCTCT